MRSPRQPLLVALLCHGVAGVLLLAALLKARQWLYEPAWTLLGLPRWMMAGVVLVELALGVALVLAWRRAWVCRAGAMIFSLLSLAALAQALRGASDCGCFGQVAVHPWLTFGFDLTAAGALAWCGRADSTPTVFKWQTPVAAGSLALLAGGMLWLAWPAGLMGGGSSIQREGELIIDRGGLIVLEPETWQGKPFPWLREAEGLVDLRTGTWRVLLFHHDCAECRKFMKRLPNQEGQRWLLVSVPPHGGEDAMRKGASLPMVRLDAGKRWFAQTPAVLTVEQGIVTQVDTPEVLRRQLAGKGDAS